MGAWELFNSILGLMMCNSISEAWAKNEFDEIRRRKKAPFREALADFLFYPPENVTIFPLFLANIKKSSARFIHFILTKIPWSLSFVMFFFLLHFCLCRCFLVPSSPCLPSRIEMFVSSKKEAAKKARKYFNYMASKWIKFQIFYRYFIFSTAVWIALDMYASIGRSCITAATTVFASQNQAIGRSQANKMKSISVHLQLHVILKREWERIREISPKMFDEISYFVLMLMPSTWIFHSFYVFIIFYRWKWNGTERKNRRELMTCNKSRQNI